MRTPRLGADPVIKLPSIYKTAAVISSLLLPLPRKINKLVKKFYSEVPKDSLMSCQRACLEVRHFQFVMKSSWRYKGCKAQNYELRNHIKWYIFWERLLTRVVRSANSHPAAQSSNPGYTASSRMCELPSHFCGLSSRMCKLLSHVSGLSSRVYGALSWVPALSCTFLCVCEKVVSLPYQCHIHAVSRPFLDVIGFSNFSFHNQYR